MRRYEVKMKIDTSNATTVDDLKRWLTCLGPAATVLDVRLIAESQWPVGIFDDEDGVAPGEGSHG